MEITLRDLIAKNSNLGIIKWFEKTFGDKAKIENVIKHLEENKDYKGYIEWLFEAYKLSGECKSWYENGKVWAKTNYKDGKLHGECKYWYSNGQILEIVNYKDEKMDGECKFWKKHSQILEITNYKDGIRLIKEGAKK